MKLSPSLSAFTVEKRFDRLSQQKRGIPQASRKEEKGLSLKLTSTLSLLFCPVPLAAEMFLPRPPVALWSQEAGGRDTLGAVLLSLPAPSRKSIHPTTVVDRHKQQRRRLVDLLRHINMLWAKGAAAPRAARARRRTDPALFRGRFCTGAHARNFP